jgi:hypothetical protein
MPRHFIDDCGAVAVTAIFRNLPFCESGRIPHSTKQGILPANTDFIAG